MKKALLTIAAIALLAAPASAQMVGIYADEAGTIGCVECQPIYVPLNTYVVLWPGSLGGGATALEYRMEVPLSHYQSGPITQNTSIITSQLGVWYNGDNAVTFSCQTSPVWIVSIPFACATEDSEHPGCALPAYFEIVNNTQVGTIQIADCDDEGGRPKHPCGVWNMFGFNAPCVTGTEESSWGAIKSMME
jgi:hypothetical protein